MNTYNIKVAWSTDSDGGVNESIDIQAQDFKQMLDKLEKEYLDIKLEDYDSKDGDFKTWAIYLKDYLIDDDEELTPLEYFKRYPEAENMDSDELPFITRFLDIVEHKRDIK